MRQNPFNPNNMSKGKTPDFRSINDAMQIPYSFATRNPAPIEEKKVDPAVVEMIEGLLSNMVQTFKTHGFDELAKEADDILAILR
tara:strand:+ start:273 stop:527 length:255 start_codon:yes stop_codon:yes gene_type:complete